MRTRAGDSFAFLSGPNRADLVPGYFIFHRAIYPLPKPAPLVSLVIAAVDRVDLRALVEGILGRTITTIRGDSCCS